MKLYDQHVHSHHSYDSDADPRENVEAALARGLAGITFTEHFDTHPEEWPTCRFDYQRVREEIDRLREVYGDRLFVGMGVEICYQPDQMPRIFSLLDAGEFDLVMLSVHWSRSGPIFREDYWRGRDRDAALRDYLQTVLNAVQFCEQLRSRGEKRFDVLGHLDFAKRYAQRFTGGFAIEPHVDLIDEILAGCLAADLIPEVNTSTLRQGLGEPMPAGWVIDRYAEAGGRVVSLGSDAHRSSDIGADFDRAAQIVRTAGLEGTVQFVGRTARVIALDAPAEAPGEAR